MLIGLITPLDQSFNKGYRIPYLKRDEMDSLQCTHERSLNFDSIFKKLFHKSKAK